MDGKVGRLGGRKSAFKGGMRAVDAHKVWLMKILGVLFFRRATRVGGNAVLQRLFTCVCVAVVVCGGLCGWVCVRLYMALTQDPV